MEADLLHFLKELDTNTYFNTLLRTCGLQDAYAKDLEKNIKLQCICTVLGNAFVRCNATPDKLKVIGYLLYKLFSKDSETYSDYFTIIRKEIRNNTRLYDALSVTVEYIETNFDQIDNLSKMAIVLLDKRDTLKAIQEKKQQ